jgi:hypothetical protein
MVPQFNGGAYSPVTPNNGNPNTVYNQPRQDDPQRELYMPAFEQPQDMAVTRVDEYSRGPMVPEFMGESAVKPTATATTPSFAKPMVPEQMNMAKPRVPESVPTFNNQSTNQVSGYNSMSRSPYSLTLEQPPEPTGRLNVNTMYSDGLRNLMSELTSLQRPVATIPIPGVGAPAQPTGPTTPGGTNAQLPNLSGGGNNPIFGAGADINSPGLGRGPGLGGTDSNEDFWRIWNDQYNANMPGHLNSPIPGNIGSQLGLPSGASIGQGLSSIFSSIGRELREGMPSSWSDAGYMALDTLLFPGSGQLLRNLVESDEIPLQELERMDTLELARTLLRTEREQTIREGIDAARNAPPAGSGAVAPVFNAQNYYNSQEEMTPAQWRAANNLIGMASAAANSNLGSWTPDRLSTVSGTGSYMAPGAAVVLNGFTQADTRSTGMGDTMRREMLNRARNIGQNIIR